MENPVAIPKIPICHSSRQVVPNHPEPSKIPVASANDKNFVISSIAKADSLDVPTPVSMNKIIAGNRMDMKLSTKLVLDVRGYYNDGTIANSGPIPPRVDQETTYTLHWIAKNVSNDVTGVKAEAVFPTGVVMTGKTWPDGAHLTYNERNNSLVWDIGNMKAGDGILTAPPEVSFQVKIKPALSQAGNYVRLINESTISATDSFTGEKIISEADAKDTRLSEDSQANLGSRVVE